MLRIFYCLLSFSLLTGHAYAQTSLIERVQKLETSLVSIKTVYSKPMPKGRVVSYERMGAGIIIDPSGLIVTNTHTIINAPHIYVILHDGSKMEAQVAFVSMDNDFSFLKITPQRPLKAVAWADSSKVRIGDEIVAVGSSEYNDRSILAGQIISLIQSKTTGAIELLGLDLNLYRGDSGGPILNDKGRLLGIVMGKEKNKDRTSFAIASNIIWKQYARYKKK